MYYTTYFKSRLTQKLIETTTFSFIKNWHRDKYTEKWKMKEHNVEKIHEWTGSFAFHTLKSLLVILYAYC